MSDPGIDERAACKTLSARRRLKCSTPRTPFLTDVNHQSSQAGGFRDVRKTLLLMEDRTGRGEPQSQSDRATDARTKKPRRINAGLSFDGLIPTLWTSPLLFA